MAGTPVVLLRFAIGSSTCHGQWDVGVHQHVHFKLHALAQHRVKSYFQKPCGDGRGAVDTGVVRWECLVPNLHAGGMKQVVAMG